MISDRLCTQPVERQQQMIRECFTLISKRSDRVCNFLEDVGAWSKDTKLVYRVYATLYFIFVVDGSESELGILDLVHVFVESLDHVFENVCELDLIFHTDKVHHILVSHGMLGMSHRTGRCMLVRCIATVDCALFLAQMIRGPAAPLTSFSH